MVKFEFVQPVGTNELPMGLTVPKEAMDALRDSAPYPGKEAKPPEEISELLLAERERQVGKVVRERQARDFLTWLHAAGFRVVNTNMPDRSEIGPRVATESLVLDYAKQVPA